MRPVWTVRLGRQAEQDYVEILQWTTKTLGETPKPDMDLIRVRLRAAQAHAKGA
jgi:hypothetical protein